MLSRVCPACGARIEDGAEYHECSACRRNYHLRCRCQAHPVARHVPAGQPPPPPVPPERIYTPTPRQTPQARTQYRPTGGGGLATLGGCAAVIFGILLIGFLVSIANNPREETPTETAAVATDQAATMKEPASDTYASEIVERGSTVDVELEERERESPPKPDPERFRVYRPPVPVPQPSWTPSAPPAPEPEPEPVETTDSVLLSRVEPQYTVAARRAKVRGFVILELDVSSDGEVTDVRVKKSLPLGLTDSATAAARQWRFRPATVNGRPVSSVVSQTIVFNLQ